MGSQTLFITGANRGLGYETVKALLASAVPYSIILGSRSLESAERAIKALSAEIPATQSSLTALAIDIEDDQSIARAFDEVFSKHEKIDVLLNNAGASFDSQLKEGNMSIRDIWMKSWNVNTAGTYIITHTFMPLLLKSPNPRLVFITSGTSPLGETENLNVPVNKPMAKGWPKSGGITGVPAYRSSKTGMNMMVREWCRILKEDGVKVFNISPGLLATGLGGDPELLKKMGAADPQIGAGFIRDVVEGKRDSDVGKAIRINSIQPW